MALWPLVGAPIGGDFNETVLLNKKITAKIQIPSQTNKQTDSGDSQLVDPIPKHLTSQLSHSIKTDSNYIIL